MDARVAAWVAETFGPVAETLFEASHLSSVTAVRTEDGRQLVVKVRGGPDRARACVEVQDALHRDGFPCPEPLTPVVVLDGLAVHAEEYVAGERLVVAPSEESADELAALLADLLSRTRRLKLPRPRPAPMWLAWDHDGQGVWPPLEEPPPRPDAVASEPWLTETVERLRVRLAGVTAGAVVGHGDWEAQNMARRTADGTVIVHDWDSLATRPEPALVGAAAATFASGDQPTLVPIEATARFIESYQRHGNRTFSADDVEVAWASGLWLATHNARMELLYGRPPSVTEQLAGEVGERLRRAGAGG